MIMAPVGQSVFAAVPILMLVSVAPARAEQSDLAPYASIAKIREIEKSRPWECLNYDPSSKTCEAAAVVRWHDDTIGESKAISLVNDNPEVSLSVHGGQWRRGYQVCAEMTNPKIELMSQATISNGVKITIESRVTQHLRQQGTIWCTALQERGDHFEIVLWIDEQPKGVMGTLHMFEHRPPLRMPDRTT